MEYSYEFIRSIMKDDSYYPELVKCIDEHMKTSSYEDHLRTFYEKILEERNAGHSLDSLNLGKIYASICQPDKNLTKSIKEVYVIVPGSLDKGSLDICKVKGKFAEAYYYPNQYYMIYDSMGLCRYTFINNSQMIFTTESAAQEFAEFYKAYSYYKNPKYEYIIRDVNYIF